ncbi:MAG: beta-ketoacyl-ACP synthase II [Chloroflexi bacterium]|nr:beta-ketoacyl-ACP synthase II [Chloroflexota bacterium]
MPDEQRVVVTGLGAICPVGNDVPSAWAALVDGRSGVGRITKFDASPFAVDIVAEVRDFHPEEVIPGKQLRRMTRPAQYAVVAAQEAVADAGLQIDESNAEEVGVIFGSAGGGYGLILEQQRIFQERGARRVTPFLISHMLPDASSGHIAIMLGAQGPNLCPGSACSTGTSAVGEAMETIRRGDAKAIICGGTDEPLLPVLMAGFQALRGIADDPDPTKACKPFDAKRNGFVVGEGAAALVLESLASARARDARCYAEVVGYGSSSDAHDMEAPHESARGPALAMGMALRKSGLPVEEIDYINAHGTGTPLNDRVETAAIKAVFGEHAYTLAVSSTKSMVGHMMGGAGALEAVVTAKAVHEGVLPPTINYETPDPDCDLDYVPNVARRTEVRAALSNSVGLGGHNAAVIFRRMEK